MFLLRFEAVSSGISYAYRFGLESGLNYKNMVYWLIYGGTLLIFVLKHKQKC
jgi:hypothetical protein